MHLSFRRSNLTLYEFSDADLGGDLDGIERAQQVTFLRGGTTINRNSKLQGRVSLSTTEDEYVAISKVAKEMIWLMNLVKELGKQQDDSPLFSDNQNVICLTKNPIPHSNARTLN